MSFSLDEGQNRSDGEAIRLDEKGFSVGKMGFRSGKKGFSLDAHLVHGTRACSNKGDKGGFENEFAWAPTSWRINFK